VNDRFVHPSETVCAGTENGRYRTDSSPRAGTKRQILTTRLILIPSISFSNSSTAPLSLCHSPTYLKPGPPSTFPRARQVLERDLTPALRRVHDGALEHGVGVEQIPQRRPVVGLHVVAPAVDGGHLHISGVGRCSFSLATSFSSFDTR
jgi:hypothetical protein